MKTRDLTVILYDRQGCEISRAEAFDTMKRAKEHARHMLSDAFAESSETTHAAFQTMKAAIFKDGEPTGANAVCEWDKEHPQHAEWMRLDSLADAIEAGQDGHETQP